jgi:hypothetical protein
MTNKDTGPSVQGMLIDIQEARELARKMYQTLVQFPTSIDELVEDWPQDPPHWLIRP